MREFTYNRDKPEGLAKEVCMALDQIGINEEVRVLDFQNRANLRFFSSRVQHLVGEKGLEKDFEYIAHEAPLNYTYAIRRLS